jgi:DNA primase
MLTDARAVCERLGLLKGPRSFVRQAGGVIIRCPVHQEYTPSCSVRRASDGTLAWRCHGCQASGDVLTLVAVVNGLNVRSDFRSVLRAAAEVADAWSIIRELDSGEIATDRPAPPPPPAPEPPRDYPPAGDIDALWSLARPVTEDNDVSAWLVGRGLDPELVEADDLARALPKGCTLPGRGWSYQRVSWAETGHRLIVPMRDTYGAMRSIRACRVVDGDSPKRLPPGGYRATDLVMACPIGIAMLRGEMAPTEVAILEGEPDWLTWSTRRTTSPVARIGIVTGSWSFEMARRIPAGASVWICTDHDAAGERYAFEIATTLRWRGCFVRRGV